MATAAIDISDRRSPAHVSGADYPLYGHVRAGGPYNSHLVSAVGAVGLAACGWVPAWLAAWILLCLTAALVLDGRAWKRKIVLAAIPGQLALYAQLLARAAWDALPYYALAYLVYVCVAPVWRAADLAVSSFVLLYGFCMAVRAGWLVRFLWLVGFRWEAAGPRFQTHEANLRSRGTAVRHVLWSCFLGNVGLVVRCSVQVVTIAGFESLRRRLGMDLSEHPALGARLVPICIAATAVWAATLYFAIRQALLIYYRAHRTLHRCRPLYDSVHGIHHRAVLPTPLDSGTISPAEFAITEMAIPAATLLPNWWWTIIQITLAVAGHWPSHDTAVRMKFFQHHLRHHRFFNVNFGLTPGEDARFGTLYAAGPAGAGQNGSPAAAGYRARTS